MKEKLKQNHKVTVFAILLSLVSIAILVVGFLLVSSDKVVMLQSLSNLYNKVNENFEDDYTLMDKIATSSSIGVKGNISIKKDNITTTVDYNYLEDKSKKESSLALSALDETQVLFDADLKLNGNKLYFFLDGITQNSYYTDYDFKSYIRSLNGNDYEKLVLLLKDAVSDGISNNSIKKEKVTIKLNGKDKKVNKLTYTFDNKKLDTVLKRFFSSIKNDKKLLKDMANFFNVSSKNLKKEFDNLRLNLTKEDRDIFSYSTYYYGFNKIVEYNLYINSKDMLIDYKVEDKNSTINIKIGEEEKFNVSITNTNKMYEFEGYVKDFSIIDSDYLESFNDLKFSGTYTDKSLDIIVNNHRIILERKNIDNDSFKVNTVFKLYEKEEEKEKMIYDINIVSEYYFDSSVDKITEEAKSVLELDSEEYNLLKENYENSYLYTIYPDLLNIFEKGE